MRKIRVFAAMLLLGMVLSTGYITTHAQGDFGGFETEGCGRCSCQTPNTGKYGTKQPLDTACNTCDCYVDVIGG